MMTVPFYAQPPYTIFKSVYRTVFVMDSLLIGAVEVAGCQQRLIVVLKVFKKNKLTTVFFEDEPYVQPVSPNNV